MTEGAKQAMRLHRLERRRATPPAARAAAAAELARRLLALDFLASPARIAAYWPFGTEPSPLPAYDLLRARGSTVLLPVGRADGDVDWAELLDADALTRGRWGFAEPAGPLLGVAAIAGVDVVIVPALAVDAGGGRLGRGSGSYDRALARVRPGVPIVAIVYDDEVVAAVPMEPHDRPVTHIVTPRRTLVVGPGVVGSGSGLISQD